MEKRIGHELRVVQQLLHQKIEEKRKEASASLTHVQIRTLMYISNNDEPIFQKDIEKYIKVRRSTASEILNVLERDGYIMRKQSKQDARMKEISITDKTRYLVGRMELHMQETERMLRQDINEADLTTFFKVIDQIKNNLE